MPDPYTGEFSDAAVRHYQDMYCRICDDAVRVSPGVWRFPHLRWADPAAQIDVTLVIEPRDGHKSTAAVIALRLYRDGAVTLPATWT